MKLLRNLGIRHRVLLLALLPTLLVTLLVASVTTYQRIGDARQSLLDNGFLILDHLARGGEYGVLAGNRDALAQLATSATTRPWITAISFLDAAGNPLYGDQRLTVRRLQSVGSPGYRTVGDRWQLHRPIRLSSLAVDDFDTHPSGEPVLLGWVVLEISDAELKQREQSILLVGVMIATAGLLISVWLALFIGRTISRPVQQISATVEQLHQDQLDARVRVSDGGELGELAEGINNLAVRVHHTQTHLQHEITKATQDLKITLDALELQNRKLEQAREQAEQANQTKDQFLARMSHELRTPLTSVLGFVDLLDRTQLDPAQRGYVEVVQRTSRLLLSLIDDLLDFSKLASDAITLESIAFNLDECVEEVLNMHLANARQKGVDLVLVPDPALPEQVAGDPTRIVQILSNLVGNAIKFTQHGEVVVSLLTHTRGSRVEVTLEVRDTGIGISEQQQTQLFQPFAQADASINRRFGGTGLGLVISRRLAELMGGTLSLHSTAGVGTRVQVQFTLTLVSAAPPAQAFNGLPVLFYDRRPLSHRAIRRRLEYWGCEVTPARNRRQLLSLLQQHPDHYQRLILSLSQRERAALETSHFLGPARAGFEGAVILISDADSAQLQQQSPQLLTQLQPLIALQKPLRSHALVDALRGDHPQDDCRTRQTPLSDRRLAGLRVLIAEDNGFNQMLISRMLELHGAEPLVVQDGAEAVARVQDTPLDLVLMDIHMPVLDGIAATRAIRSLPGPEADLPIITLTANIVAQDAAELEALGIDASLSKPIDEAALVARIAESCRAQCPLAPEPQRLERYGISRASLHRELRQQLDALHQGVAANDDIRLRDHSHQLMGLAGLVGLNAIDDSAQAFNRAVKAGESDAMQAHLGELARLIAALEAGP